MNKSWILIILVLILIILGGFFVIPGRLAGKVNIEVPQFLQKPFKLGLDLQGGVYLLYQADLSQIEKDNQESSIEGLRDIMERRVNPLGVQEPIVQLQKAGDNYRLMVELAGIEDPQEVIGIIDKPTNLEFREEMSFEEKMEVINMIPMEEVEKMIENLKLETGEDITKEDLTKYIPLYNQTDLTGRYLKKAQIQFDQTAYEPMVAIEFDSEGAKLFEELTRKNWHKPLAIFIDNQLISSPIVGRDDSAEEGCISGGKAVISGGFALDEAKQLAQNLNAGALPVPIELISAQSIGPSLGKISIEKSIIAGMIGFLLVILFMIVIYRFSGLLAIISLFAYIIILLSLFKFASITLTLSGIAGFILSLGMAVDANILIFERLKEEVENSIDDKAEISLGRNIDSAFSRAFTAIRDGNLTTLIICVILFLVASGFVQGFALTLGIGILISMFSAMVITKLFMKTLAGTKLAKFKRIWIR